VTSESHEHWLDKMAAAPTRRQALKIALGTAAALVFPVAQSKPADAESGGSCSKGCLWTSYQKLLRAFTVCRVTTVGSFFWLAAWPAVGPFVTKEFLSGELCFDSAVLGWKASNYDCLQPGCPGFNPKAPGGPCDSCKANCCICSQLEEGYICCFYGCDDPDHSCC
jgi:hypothetical protein